TDLPDTPAPAPPTAPPNAAPSPTAGTADTPAPATSAPAVPTALPPSAVPESDAPTALAMTDGPLPAFTRTLRVQAPPLQGEDVKAAQRRLLELRYTEVGQADGVFGQNTERAVRSFQSANTLDADGIIGPKTWERLFSATAVAGPAIIPIVDGDSGDLIGGGQGGTRLGARAATGGA